ncbi:tetratricopeptide repeat protein [Rhodoferax sp.]|uniref:YfgM family protein n=1 Tax=Rhodoferax sp. TaxID=50421 RepID=UPI002ACEA323|nr:tetratricopeptide repeat protein [Rhodoferax sp.]MDZ7919239.1 tetratricopeptide repeat protein [Rhodoferax sp.]
MANHLDLEEQEQLDQIKHFWKQYGNLITGLLIVVLGAFAAWNGYQYWQKRAAAQASVMFEEVDKVLRSGDLVLAERVFGDMKDRFASTVYTQQAGLALAKLAYQSDKSDLARTTLVWVSASQGDPAYAAIAKLRLSGMYIESKEFDLATKVLAETYPAPFVALVADKKGDMLMAQGKGADAVVEYRKAWAGLDTRAEYRRLVSVKLGALGASETAPN